MWYVLGVVGVLLLIIGTLRAMKEISAISAAPARKRNMRLFAFLWPVSVLVWSILRRRVMQETTQVD